MAKNVPSAPSQDEHEAAVTRAMLIMVEESEKPHVDWGRVEKMWRAMSNSMYNAVWDAFCAYNTDD